jgi:DNA-binding MarR family transcriptional regulator
MTQRSAADCAGLDGDLGWQLGSVFRAYARAANAALAELPGGPRGYQVLAATEAGNAGTQLALATRMGVDRTVMTYLLDDLEAAGVIERRPDPTDRRARRLVLTSTGATTLAAANERLRLAEEHILAALSADDRSTFRRLLSRVAAHAANDGDQQDACRVATDIT